jgi:hypothetical protein
MEHKILISPARAWERATPAQRRTWFPDGAPAGTDQHGGPYGAAAGHGSGASWDAEPAGLAKAERAGMAALAAGYGGVLPDGMAPCATCPACQVGRPQDCRRPRSKAEARLLAGQAVDADRVRASATVAELEMLVVELAAGLG